MFKKVADTSLPLQQISTIEEHSRPPIPAACSEKWFLITRKHEKSLPQPLFQHKLTLPVVFIKVFFFNLAFSLYKWPTHPIIKLLSNRNLSFSKRYSRTEHLHHHHLSYSLATTLQWNEQRIRVKVQWVRSPGLRWAAPITLITCQSQAGN